MFIFLVIFSTVAISQGTNNDFDYDKEDLDMISKELGFHTFKFPVRQTNNQLFDFVIEEFENGKLLQTISVIDVAKEKFKKFGLDVSRYFQPKAEDSVYFHRIYFQHHDTLMKVKIKTHGVGSEHEFSFSGKSTFDLRALYSVKTEIDSIGHITLDVEKPKPLMFLYAIAADDKDGVLWCPAGAPKDKLIENFYYVIYISMKEYDHTPKN